MATSRLCSIPNCDKLARRKSYCSAHHHRYLRYGDPLAGGPPVGLPAEHLINVILPYRGKDCIEWPFTRMASGYGQVTFNKKRSLVHRLVCELTNGPPAPKMQAAHNCGNAKCVNPKHIRWATVADNLSDRHVHGTMTIGERHGHSKLTKVDVCQIKVLLRAGFQIRSIAKRFQVTDAAIRDIKTGKSWGWLEQAPKERTSP